MKRLTQITLLLALVLCLPMRAQQVINLAGTWNFQLDRNDVGVTEKWFNSTALDDRIDLPGSMTERMKGDDVTAKTRWVGSLYDSSYYYNPHMEKYRREGNVKFPFFLTPNKHYVGVAWYQRSIDVSEAMAVNPAQLFLERPHIITRVWLNGKELEGENTNSLCVPHIYNKVLLRKGANNLVIRIDNRVDEVRVGNDSHSVTDQTQGDWNGIVGRMELQFQPTTCIDDVQIYPDIKGKTARVHLKLRSNHYKNNKMPVTLSAESFNSPTTQRVPPVTQTVKFQNGEAEADIVLPMGNNVQLWDEFNPALYRLKISYKDGKEMAEREATFGMRDFAIQGKMFYINGRETELRGTVENCDFPLTGYAPMDVESWMRVFQTCRRYGLNHMRFHSFCPPEAAFEAADRVGFYLQPEGPSWPNHGVKLGNGQFIDNYLMDETKQINKVYGNHPSFCMMACGNEPAGNWVKWVSAFVDYWRTHETRRVFTGASVGGGWAWQPRSMYHVKAGARGLGEWARRAPESTSDYRARIDTVSQPYVSHETGQWCAFPDFDEISKYTGVTRAKNFEIFRDILTENHMGDLARKFMLASGKLQVLCYKNEIERTLRTPKYAGFQLLALNDYSGQGTALVGPLNVFFEEKGYVDDKEFSEFCAPTVVLARIPKFTYYNDDAFMANLELSHFGQAPIRNAQVIYELTDADGKVLKRETLVPQGELPIGSNTALGEVEFGRFQMEKINKAEKLTLSVKLSGTEEVDGQTKTIEAKNHWNIWVFPRQSEFETGSVYECDTLDEKALAVLKKGGNVLICAGGKIKYGKDIVQQFLPVFWNTSWFKMRPPHTTGLYIRNEHPLFADFPTDYYSDLQWWELVNRQQVMQFTEFPADFQPIVQSIDTWFLSRKIGMLFEANVLKGKLIMTTMPINGDPNDQQGAYMNRPASMQMKKTILEYMNSDNFKPQFALAPSLIQNLFTKEAPKVSMFTNESPDELKPKLNQK